MTHRTIDARSLALEVPELSAEVLALRLDGLLADVAALSERMRRAEVLLRADAETTLEDGPADSVASASARGAARAYAVSAAWTTAIVEQHRRRS